MLKFFTSIFADRLINKIIELIKQFAEEIKNEKIIKEKLNDIQKEKDPQERAKRMRDFLNS